MNSTWKKVTNGNTLEEVMNELADVSVGELLNPAHESPDQIVNLIEVKQFLQKAIAADRHITIVGDYDADGVCAVAILFLLLKELNADVSVRIPKRISEGYGMAPCIVKEITNEFPSGVIVTVDNGIAATEAVALAKEKGSDVLIIDHHLPLDEIPEADIIVDPHIYDEGFQDYCGAGLAYALAELFLKDTNNELLSELLSLAAVATVADVVPLVGENRILVQKGLKNLNDGITTVGMKQLLTEKKIKAITSETIAYQIAPALNAPGRLMDEGAKLSAGILASRSPRKPEQISAVWQLNNQRKDLVAKAVLDIEQTHLYHKNPIIVFNPSLKEGICGILAGNLCEKYRKPAFVLTKSEDGNWKGSARGPKGIHMKELLDKANQACESLITYGGHEGAVGLKVKAGEEDIFSRVLSQITPQDVQEAIIEYHLELSPDEISNVQQALPKYEPYGAGCPKPRILWKGCSASPTNSYRYMGNTNQHVKVNCGSYDILLFNRAQEFSDMGCPTQLDVIGNVSINDFDGRLQIIADEFRCSQ